MKSKSSFVLFLFFLCFLPSTLYPLPSLFGLAGSRELHEISARTKTALENKQWHEALRILEDAKRRFPTNGKIRLALAYLYRQVGLYPQARSIARWSVKHHSPSSVEYALACRELAWTTFNMKLYEEALETLSKLKERSDADWALEARIRLERRQWPEALSALEKISSPAPLVSFWKGWALWHMAEYGQARRFLRKMPENAGSKIFAESLASSERDPWVILGYWAQKHMTGETGAIGRVSSPAKEGSIDDSAWELLGRLSGK